MGLNKKKICDRCGAAFDEDSLYCKYCGIKRGIAEGSDEEEVNDSLSSPKRIGYCKYCGKRLRRNEVCSCDAAVKENERRQRELIKLEEEQRRQEEKRRKAEEEQRRREEEKRKAEEEEQRRREEERRRAEEEQRRREEERRKAEEEEQRRREEERRKAEEEEQRRREEERRKAEEEEQSRQEEADGQKAEVEEQSRQEEEDRQEAEAEEQSRQEEEDKQKAEEEEERRKAEEERQRKAERYRQEAAEWRRQEEERQRAGIQERNNGIKWMFLGGLIGILLIGGICVLLFKNQISGYVTRVLESRQSSEDKSQGEITEIPTENIVIITEADLPDSGAAPENMFLSESEAQEETVLQEETIPQAGTPGQPETAALVETLTWKELSNATITDSRNVRQYSDSDEVRDNLGILYEPYNSFEMSAQDDEPAYLVVYNGEQFASMGGMIAVLDTTAADTTASGWMEIYADDELIYASDEEITCTTRPQNFGVDISGSEWITIRVVQREGGSGDLNIFLTSVRLDITDELVLEGYSNEIPQSKGDTSFYKDGTPVPLNGYILPDSNERYLSESDLSNLTLKGLCYAKNEIYARLGRKFKAAELREYFGKQAWYNGIYEPTDENDAMLVSRMNDYEYRNKDVLSAMEQKIGPYDVK